MKVTDVKTFLVHPGTGKNWLFVKVETDAGIHGWGEAYTQADRDHAIAVHVEQMRRYLIGRDPFQIKHFTTVMYLDFASKRGAMDFYSALSGLEQALWDIAGKALVVPVYNLLGGPCRDRIRVYANGWSSGRRCARGDGTQGGGAGRAGLYRDEMGPLSGPLASLYQPCGGAGCRRQRAGSPRGGRPGD